MKTEEKQLPAKPPWESFDTIEWITDRWVLGEDAEGIVAQALDLRQPQQVALFGRLKKGEGRERLIRYCVRKTLDTLRARALRNDGNRLTFIQLRRLSHIYELVKDKLRDASPKDASTLADAAIRTVEAFSKIAGITEEKSPINAHFHLGSEFPALKQLASPPIEAMFEVTQDPAPEDSSKKVPSSEGSEEKSGATAGS